MGSRAVPNPKPPDPRKIPARPRDRRRPPPPVPMQGKPKSCPLELVTTVPVVIVALLAKAAWRRVTR